MTDAIEGSCIVVAGVCLTILKDVWVRRRTEASERAALASKAASSESDDHLHEKLEQVEQERDTFKFTTVALPEFLIHQIEVLQGEKAAIADKLLVAEREAFIANLHALELEADKRRQGEDDHDSKKQP